MCPARKTDLSEAAVTEAAPEWLGPALEAGGQSVLQESVLLNALRNWLSWSVTSEIDRLAPKFWPLSGGRQVRIEYDVEQAPMSSLRVQDLYGVKIHPSICDGRVPLTLSLLSPAQRPVAITKDLPGFWAGGYSDMRKDMRGRYPRHDWPEDPANASPPKPRERR